MQYITKNPDFVGSVRSTVECVWPDISVNLTAYTFCSAVVLSDSLLFMWQNLHSDYKM